jgi:Mrp family chromosome partitioning ATPase
MVRNELNKLVLRIFLSDPPTKVVVFTGVEAEASAKWIAGCTADILAGKVEGRVCLMDVDFASPSIHRLYSVSNHEGLAAVLSGSCSISGSTIRAAENLWIIPAGTQSKTSQISAAQFRPIVGELLEQFDYLILAAPDCDAQTNLDVFGAEAEGAVLVIDAATTRRAAAREAKSALETAQLRVLGSVFNRQPSVPDFLYLHM